MASVTSLPELITGASSVVIFDRPNIAIGDVFGSCMFNILIIALLDVLTAPTPISAKAQQGQVLTAGFGVCSWASPASPFPPALVWVGIYSVAFFATYVIAMRMVFCMR